MKHPGGRPSRLDDHLFKEIKGLVLEGLNLKEIAEALDISYATIRDWEYENYKGFSDKMLSFKHERMLRKAEINVETLMDSEDERVMADMSKFVLERLNKKTYSSRVESTGADGQSLTITFDESFKKKNATPNTTSETEGDSI